MKTVNRSVLSPAELASEFGIGQRQAREFIAAGGIYSFRVGRRILVPRKALEALLAGEQAPESADRPALPKAVNGEPAGATPAAPAADRRALRLG